MALFSRPRDGAVHPKRGLPEPAAGRGPVIAIIGGGASGTLAAVHLLRAAVARRVPLRIALIDRLGRHGLGQAYATTNPDHAETIVVPSEDGQTSKAPSTKGSPTAKN